MVLIHIPQSKQKTLLQSGALVLKTPTLGNTLFGHVADVRPAEGILARCVNGICSFDKEWSHAAGEQQLAQKSFFQVIQVSDMCGLKGRECVILSKQ